MSLVHEIDYGTPRPKTTKEVTLTIDGQKVTVPEGTSIMRAAMEVGTQIPKLCATDMVDAFGSCRSAWSRSRAAPARRRPARRRSRPTWW
jgi:formate dehydrogenase major subunit